MRLYEFVSTGCHFCAGQKKAQVLERMAATKGLECMRVDADKREDLADKYSLRGVPAYVLTSDSGEVLGKHVGAATVAQLEALVKKHTK